MPPPRTNASGGFDSINNSMNFTTGNEKGFTRTPANVKQDYVQTASPAPTTTKKRKSTTTETPKSILKKTAPAKSTPETTTKRRKTGPKEATTRQIPHSFDECTPADQSLITMRDAGATWTEIRNKWQSITGEKTGVSTLPNRYARLKSNFTVIKEEDNARLLEAKREVEESFEAQKWDLVARVVGEKGGDTYAGVVLQRQYKKLMVQGGVMPPEGVRDGDFEDPVSEEE